LTGEFSAPTRVLAGRGCVAERLGEEIARLRVRVVAVVADLGFAEAGLLEPLLPAVDGVSLPLCGLIAEDPGVAQAEAAARAALEAGAEAVLGVGGGSGLCAAKAVAIRLTNPPPLAAYEGRGRLLAWPAPIVAVPTTAGSGTEVSNVVVLHEPGRERDLVIGGRGYEPPVALLDGELLRTLPRRPLIAAALDALSHALEALWARGATRFTDALALSAARRVRASLPPALDGDVDAMQELIEASAMANLACGNSGLGLVHALSAAPRLGLPHGELNGVLLPVVAEFNRQALRGDVLGEIDALAGLYATIGFTARLPDGVAERMVAAAMTNPFRDNNARPAGPEEMRALVATAGRGPRPASRGD
jgi:alcohol dehydrogenase class IV